MILYSRGLKKIVMPQEIGDPEHRDAGHKAMLTSDGADASRLSGAEFPIYKVLLQGSLALFETPGPASSPTPTRHGGARRLARAEAHPNGAGRGACHG